MTTATVTTTTVKEQWNQAFKPHTLVDGGGEWRVRESDSKNRARRNGVA